MISGYDFFAIIVILFLGSVVEASSTQRFRVMTLNIWECGAEVNDGYDKILKHIGLIKPDIVMLQEVRGDNCYERLNALPGWHKVFSGDSMILSKWEILAKSNGDWAYLHAKLKITENRNMDVFTTHLDHRDTYCAARGNSVEEILECESVRARLIRQMISWENLKNAQNESLNLIAGDFNSPSHFDWIESTKSTHFGKAVEWPATKQLADIGFKDSFREMYPNPLKTPANTWSTVQKDNDEFGKGKEPQDRIDFILYRGLLKVLKSEIYAGTEPLDKGKDNDWPSDHFAVYTDFEFI